MEQGDGRKIKGVKLELHPGKLTLYGRILNCGSRNMYDNNTNTLLLTQRSSKGSMQQRLNVSKLKTGYYVLEITEGINKQSIKFLKE